LNAAEASNVASYRLVIAGKHGSFTGKKVKVIRLRSAVYNAALDQVTLTPKKPFSLNKPVELLIPAGLHGSSGRLIDGGEAVALILSRRGATESPATVRASSNLRPALRTAAVDIVLEQIKSRR
jgi:hypothetical protein